MPEAPGQPDVTIVLPAYNEAERIGPALDELFGYLDGPARSGEPATPGELLGDWRVLVVDDGSTDGTAELVARRPEAAVVPGGPPRLGLLREPHGGKGAAVRAGMLAADGRVVLFADADLATPPDQIPVIVAALADHDLAVGSRVHPDGTDRRASQPAYRRLMGRAFRFLAGLWVHTRGIPDTQCGFKAFRHDVAQDLFGRQRVTSIVFDVELIHLARRRGYRLAVVPVSWSDKRGSRMRVRPGLALRVLWDLIRIPVIHRREPGRSALATRRP